MEEIWRPVVGYEGLYEVSNCGNVRSLNYHREKRVELLKPVEVKRYLRVDLRKNNETNHHLVHRLVGEAFIPNPNNLPQINHKDENTKNNCVWNLEWCDMPYNINYGTGIKRRSEKRKNGSNSKEVYQYTLDGILVHIYPSLMECVRNGFNRGHLSSCCSGKRETHKGYRWSHEPL